MVLSDKPEEIVNFYPLELRTKWLADNHGIPVPAELNYRGDGLYTVETGRAMYAAGHTLRLPSGGQTKCVKQEVLPIAPPKVRKGIELRWRGRWEKYLKTKGWVVA
jgi:hypothetical protein